MGAIDEQILRLNARPFSDQLADCRSLLIGQGNQDSRQSRSSAECVVLSAGCNDECGMLIVECDVRCGVSSAGCNLSRFFCPCHNASKVSNLFAKAEDAPFFPSFGHHDGLSELPDKTTFFLLCTLVYLHACTHWLSCWRERILGRTLRTLTDTPKMGTIEAS